MLKVPEYFKIETITNMANTYQNIDLTQLFDASVSQDAIKDIYTVSKEIVDLIRRNYLSEGMSPQGKLANFDSVINYDGNLYQLQLMLPPEWKWVEYGRYPGPVNRKGIESIEQWINIKGLVPQARNGKIPSTKSLAFAIAKKIQKVGYYTPSGATSIPTFGAARGKHVLEKSLNESETLIIQLCNLITEKINKGVNKDIIKIFDGLESFTKKEIQN